MKINFFIITTIPQFSIFKRCGLIIIVHHDVKIKLLIHPIYIINGNSGGNYKKKM